MSNSIVTKEDFLKYEEIRKSGKYNMFMDARKVIEETGLSEEVYVQILSNYGELATKYLN